MKRRNTIIIDYGRTHYPLTPGREVPDRRAGKFVQVRNDETEYLIFSPMELTPYHADLVERFCEERKIPGSYVRERRRYDIHDPSWVVVGGGKFEADSRKKIVILYDNSMAYGRFDARELKEKIRRTKELGDYEIRIE